MSQYESGTKGIPRGGSGSSLRRLPWGVVEEVAILGLPGRGPATGATRAPCQRLQFVAPATRRPRASPPTCSADRRGAAELVTWDGGHHSPTGKLLPAPGRRRVEPRDHVGAGRPRGTHAGLEVDHADLVRVLRRHLPEQSVHVPIGNIVGINPRVRVHRRGLQHKYDSGTGGKQAADSPVHPLQHHRMPLW